jgi:glycosyltransferase involved in cell wall biosynthesis
LVTRTVPNSARLADSATAEGQQISASALIDERPTICVLALSAIADDPRVRRQAEAFHLAGWKVVAVGLPGARSPDPEWPIFTRQNLPAATFSPLGADSSVNLSRPLSPPAQFLLRPCTEKWLMRRLRSVQPLFPWIAEGRWSAIEQTALQHVQTALLPLRTMLRTGFRLRQVLTRVIRFGRIRYAARLLAVRFRPLTAQEIYWSFSDNILSIYHCAKRVTASVWLANDWTMLPLAARLAREQGGLYCYDTHEFAAEEYGDRRSWRFWHRPMVCALEREFIGGAAAVSAVSAGIAERLERMYSLPVKTLTIRNTPNFEASTFRPTAPDRIRLLYHGIVTPGRGLETTIDSVAGWRPEFGLTIRGPGAESYISDLQRRIAERGLEKRITIAPPVPMTDLVREATAFDVGFFALPGSSRHNQFALPNKFFEYIMAGLALCLTDLPEMARLVREFELGWTFSKVAPEVIAAVVNSLDVCSVDRFKRNSLMAARELCWERESQRLVTAYGAMLERALPQAA